MALLKKLRRAKKTAEVMMYMKLVLTMMMVTAMVMVMMMIMARLKKLQRAKKITEVITEALALENFLLNSVEWGGGTHLGKLPKYSRKIFGMRIFLFSLEC